MKKYWWEWKSYRYFIKTFQIVDNYFWNLKVLLTSAILIHFIQFSGWSLSIDIHRETRKEYENEEASWFRLRHSVAKVLRGNPTRYDTDFFVKRDFRINIWIGWHETGKTTYNSLEMHRYAYDRLNPKNWEKGWKTSLLSLNTYLYSHFSIILRNFNFN